MTATKCARKHKLVEVGSDIHACVLGENSQMKYILCSMECEGDRDIEILTHLYPAYTPKS